MLCLAVIMMKHARDHPITDPSNINGETSGMASRSRAFAKHLSEQKHGVLHAK
jgi:hypothetical protein